jgi:hypothetical protein
MCKEKENNWKIKALYRSKEIKKLNKELIRQKKRATDGRGKAQLLQKEIRDKDLIIKDLSSKKAHFKPLEDRAKIGTYVYGQRLIYLCVKLYKSGLSLRQVSVVVTLIGLFIGKTIKAPSHSIINIWVHKVGLGVLKKGQQSFQESCEQWSLIIDESFSLGKSRLLVILAVRLSNLQQGRIRCIEVIPLVVKSQENWKSKDISICLSGIKRKFKGKIAYVTSDCGANLLCSYQEQNLRHIPDWAHYGANLLANIYEKEDDFKAFNEKMGAFKRKRKQSIYTDYVPPNLSVKMRFMNYIPFLEWATIMLNNFKQIPQEIKAELAFLQTLEPFIKEMRALFYTVQDIGYLIKEKGINPMTYGQATQKLNKLTKDYPDNTRVQELIRAVETYFKKTLEVYFQYIDNQDKNTPFFDGIIATSEILECLFGKLKHRSDKNPKRGFSANSLLIPLFCNELKENDTTDALYDIDCKALEKWKIKNICNRKYTSFRNVFKKKRGRKK